MINFLYQKKAYKNAVIIIIEIADKFPPSDPNAPLIAENLAFPLSFSNVKEIASSMFWQFMITQKNNKKNL